MIVGQSRHVKIGLLRNPVRHQVYLVKMLSYRPENTVKPNLDFLKKYWRKKPHQNRTYQWDNFAFFSIFKNLTLSQYRDIAENTFKALKWLKKRHTCLKKNILWKMLFISRQYLEKQGSYGWYKFENHMTN